MKTNYLTTIATIAVLLLSSCMGLYAQQDSRQRTPETIAADVLAAMPARTASEFDTQMGDLAAGAPATVVEVAKLLQPAGEGVKNKLYEYALSGVTAYVSDPAHNGRRAEVLQGLRDAADACADPYNKAFLLSQARLLLPPVAPQQTAQMSVKEARKLLKGGSSAERAYAAGVIMTANPSKAAKFAVSAMRDDDKQYRVAVLDAATAIAGADALAPELEKQYPKLPDHAKSELLYWFGINGVQSSADIVRGELAAISAGNTTVGADAIEAAGRLGGEGFGGTLVTLLSSEDQAVRAAALKALKSFKGDIEGDVLTALEETGGSKDALMAMASSRHMTAAAKTIIGMAKSGDGNAAKYLAGTADGDDIQDVTALLSEADKDVPELQEALAASVSRLSADERCSILKEAIGKSSKPDNFYPVLAQTGTDEALSILNKAYDGGSQAAFAGLLGIDNPKAADMLLWYAQHQPDKAEQILPRYVALVRMYETDPVKLRRDYASALSLTDSRKIKRTVLQALGQLPTMPSFLLASSYLDDAAVKYEAAQAVKGIASKTKEEINYAELKSSLEKAAAIFAATGKADDGYAVDEINTLLGKLEPSPLVELSDEEKAQGFELLFDGSSMDKWQGNLAGYIPVNGSIYVSAGFGGDKNLYTKEQYRNFVLRFEFCFLEEGVNNGVGVRTPMGVDAAYHGMCEVQILDHDAPRYANLHDYQVHGSVYGVIPAKRIKHKPLGEWETEEIRVKGNHVTVTVNGEVILDGDVRKACKGHNVAPDGGKKNPYTVDHKNHPGMFNEKGYISFCGHGEGLKLRNIRVLDLGDKDR